MRLLAVTSAQRFEGLDHLPTLVESGYPGFVAVGTPAAVIARINADVAGVLSAAGLRGRFQALGMAAGGGSPAAFGALVQSEMKRWGPVIRQAGIRIE